MKEKYKRMYAHKINGRLAFWSEIDSQIVLSHKFKVPEYLCSSLDVLRKQQNKSAQNREDWGLETMEESLKRYSYIIFHIVVFEE